MYFHRDTLQSIYKKQQEALWKFVPSSAPV